MSHDKDWEGNVFAGLEALGEVPGEGRASLLRPLADARPRAQGEEIDELELDSSDFQALGEIELLSYPLRIA